MHEPLPRDDSNAPLTPTRLELPPAESRAVSARRGWHQTIALGLLGLLGVGVLIVFAWLPRWVATPSPIAVPPAPVATPPPVMTPETPALLLPEPPDARSAAQEALAALLPEVEALRAQRVELWGPEDLQAVETALAEGEQAYREQRFTAARLAYATAAQGVATTVARIPAVVAESLDEGERALLSQNPRAAESAFSVALRLAPDDPAALRGLRRAETFDRVLALLTEAQGYERIADAARATAAYRAALKLDPEAGAARQALSRIDQAQAEVAFARLMSQGFAALQNSDYAAAETTFAQALKQRPQSTEATNALAQTRARGTAARIDHALTAAHRAAQNEQWSEAGAQYRAALALDQSLELAAQGNELARARAALDERLRASLQRPDRLADDAVYREAEDVLSAARAVPSPGRRLTDQVTTLAALLVAARTPVPVTVQSDGATEVTVLKIGKLGLLTVHTLTLFPGRYTALGTRSGYRDTRVEFTVAAAGTPTITVQCQEALTFGR